MLCTKCQLSLAALQRNGKSPKSWKSLKERVKTDLGLPDIWDLSGNGTVGKDKVYGRDRHASDVYRE